MRPVNTNFDIDNLLNGLAAVLGIDMATVRLITIVPGSHIAVEGVGADGWERAKSWTLKGSPWNDVVDQ